MARKISYSPSLFGSNTAQQAWQIISKIIGYPEDVPLVPGLAPEMEYVFKTRLQRNRDKILKSIKVSAQQRKRNPFGAISL
jgi:hypothetical protein